MNKLPRSPFARSDVPGGDRGSPPTVSVVMPVYNVERFVGAAIGSVLAQRFEDFELIVVDDRSPDASLEVVRRFDDPRIRIVSHAENRGLAGARNSGIRVARGRHVALIDSDDVWDPDKLAAHVAHLDAAPEVGVSFSRSLFIDERGRSLDTYQMPRLTGIDADHLMCRNPVGNGSAPVIRRETLDDIAFRANLYGEEETFWFDDAFRQSEDIECWIRIAATTRWRFEGLSAPLTHYRLNSASLSADIPRQLASWEAVMGKLRGYAPELWRRSGRLARAFQLRYLARQAIRQRDGALALRYGAEALRTDPSMLLREPSRTLVTLAAALVLRLAPASLYRAVEPLGVRLIGRTQRARIALQRGAGA